VFGCLRCLELYTELEVSSSVLFSRISDIDHHGIAVWYVSRTMTIGRRLHQNILNSDPNKIGYTQSRRPTIIERRLTNQDILVGALLLCESLRVVILVPTLVLFLEFVNPGFYHFRKTAVSSLPACSALFINPFCKTSPRFPSRNLLCNM